MSNSQENKSEDNLTSTLILHNIAAEQDVLAMLLIDNNNVTYIDFLRKHHFYNSVHQKIFAIIEDLIGQEKVADITSISFYLANEPAFIEIGGENYLGQIISKTTFIASIKERANFIHDLYLRRKVIDISSQTISSIKNIKPDSDIENEISSIEKKLFDLSMESLNISNDFRNFGDISQELYKAIKDAKSHDGMTGLTTGFIDLNQMLGGLQPSDLIILAGRPSMGKTALAVNIAYNAARSIQDRAKAGLNNNKQDEQVLHLRSNAGQVKGGVGCVSLEMSSEQIVARIIAMATGVDSSKLRQKKVDSVQLQEVARALQEMAGIPLFIDDTPSISIEVLKSRARRLKKKYDISLLMIDYLQLMQGSRGSRDGNRVQEISEITQGLKAIAKELNIPVIALSQLSRMVEQRDDKRPQLSDLRESGSIEQDADVVMFIYREAYYMEREKPKYPEDMSNMGAPDTIAYNQWMEKNGEKWRMIQNISEVIIAKQRNGPIGNISLQFDAATTKFNNLKRSEEFASSGNS